MPSKPLLFIGGHVTPEDPGALVRAVLTWFWGAYEVMLTKGEGTGILDGDEYANAIRVTEFVWQAEGRPIEDIAQKFFTSSEIEDQARNLLSLPALGRAKEKLDQTCRAGLKKEISGPLIELLSVIDVPAGTFRPTILEKADGKAYEDYKAERLSDHTLRRMSVDIIYDSLAPLLPPVYGLEMYRSQRRLSLAVEHRMPPVLERDYRIVHCDQFAGMDDALGYVLGPAFGEEGDPAFLPADEGSTVYIRDEKIAVSAACLANLVRVKSVSDPLIKRLGSFLEDWEDPGERALALMRLVKERTLFHEIGHIESWDRIASVLSDSQDKHQRGYYFDHASELMAECMVYRGPSPCDTDLWREFNKLWHVSRAGFDGRIISTKCLKEFEFQQLFELRACFDNDPCSYLENLVAELGKEVIAKRGESFGSWKRKVVDEAQEVLRAKIWQDS